MLFRSRPVVARDQILRAVSADGVNFTRDEGWRWKRPFTLRPYMNYFVTRDAGGGYWWRSSECRNGDWSTILFSDTGYIDAVVLDLKNIAAPVWCEGHMFALVTDRSGQTHVAMSSGSEKSITTFERLDWPRLDELGDVDDIFVLKAADEYFG